MLTWVGLEATILIALALLIKLELGLLVSGLVCRNLIVHRLRLIGRLECGLLLVRWLEGWIKLGSLTSLGLEWVGPLLGCERVCLGHGVLGKLELRRLNVGVLHSQLKFVDLGRSPRLDA